MKKTNTYPYQLQRITSIILSSDTEDDDQDDQKLTQTQYLTPMIPHSDDIENDIKPQATITNLSQRSTSVSPIGLGQPNYLRYTINMNNQEQRLSILPTFPIVNDDPRHPPTLLLATVPINHLSQQELAYRRTGKFKPSFSILAFNASTKSFRVKQYQTYYAPLVERLNVDLSILDYNYVQLRKIIDLHRQTYIRILGYERTLKEQFNLSDHEFAPLLEFYLQIDVDLFYMKTCSFRGAQPRMSAEGLFCSMIPECHYFMERCTVQDLEREFRKN